MKRMLMTLLLLVTASTVWAQQTPYVTPQWKATFNGPVTTYNEENVAKTAMDFFYGSQAGEVLQVVAYRKIYHPISVNDESLEFYVTQGSKNGAVVTDKQKGSYKGHIYVRFYVTLPDKTLRRSWVMIYSPTELYIIDQLSPTTNDVEFKSWDMILSSFETPN